MKTVSAIISMSRPINCLITFITIVVACLICSNTLDNFTTMFIGGVVGLLVTASGNIINDYYDIDADKINRPTRALPSELITPTISIIFYLFFNIIAFVLSMSLGLNLFIITVITSFLLFLYSYKLKNIPLLGNLIVAFLTGIAFIFGSVIVGNFLCGIFPAIFAFMINFMRELVKDIEDIDGDRVVGLLTYPIKFGVINTVNVIILVGVSFLVLTTIPFLFSIYNIKYFLVVLFFVDSIIVFIILRLRFDPSSYNLKLSSNLLKLDMLIGIIAIILGNKF